MSEKEHSHPHTEGCGCGHHHEEHEEHCGCGHHHEEHEEHCGCGHHHEEHEEHCGCGHHHEEHEAHCGCGHHHEEHEEHCGCGHRHESHEAHCGCGHHHEEHEEHCGCGHHHEDHGEHCCCGHHHEAHEAHCGCGHHHEHHEEHRAGHGKSHVFLLENLGCANCAAKMEAQIRALPGVSGATITFATKQLRLTAEHPEKLLPQIQKICTSIESQVVVIPRESKAEKPKGSGHRREVPELIAGALVFAVGVAAHALGLEGFWVPAIFVLGYLILGGKVLKEAFAGLVQGHVFDEHFLMSVATLGAFAIREYPEALGVMLFYRVGEYFEHRAVERSRSQIMEAIDLRPEVVNRVRGEAVEQIPAEDVLPGDLLLIRPGDRIPVDGVIVEGSSRLDTAPITGEPVPVGVHPGDQIFSGCVNQSGQLKLKAEKPLSESMVTRILDSVENAAASKPKIDRFITRFARVYTPVVIAAAVLTAVVPSVFSGNWNYWVYTALSFLVMSCPCALVLSVPLAFFSGIGAGSRKGILFKGGMSIEALSRLKAVVMDKTGTITRGEFRLQETVSCGNLTQEALLQICAGCESHSTHPIAVSIVAAAREKGLPIAAPEAMEELPGYGIVARMPQGQVLCGNRALLERYGIDTTGVRTDTYGAEVFLALRDRLEGYFVISDSIKEDAKDAVDRLHKMGLHTAILTGDSKNSAAAVAAQTGIREVHARLLPQEKLEVLKEIRSRQGAVMFVGDGINDAPVLAGADVGAAMGSGADAAIEAADAVFMTSAAASIPEAIVIARRTNRIAVQNVVFALAVKLAVMILGLCGYANMWMAVFADSGVAMLCVLNSIRILYQKK